jgi:hypothetical protein
LVEWRKILPLQSNQKRELEKAEKEEKMIGERSLKEWTTVRLDKLIMLVEKNTQSQNNKTRAF